MGPRGSFALVNVTNAPVTASLDVELESFVRERRIAVDLDGSPQTTIVAGPKPASYRIGPMHCADRSRTRSRFSRTARWCPREPSSVPRTIGRSRSGCGAGAGTSPRLRVESPTPRESDQSDRCGWNPVQREPPLPPDRCLLERRPADGPRLYARSARADRAICRVAGGARRRRGGWLAGGRRSELQRQRYHRALDRRDPGVSGVVAPPHRRRGAGRRVSRHAQHDPYRHPGGHGGHTAVPAAALVHLARSPHQRRGRVRLRLDLGERTAPRRCKQRRSGQADRARGGRGCTAHAHADDRHALVDRRLCGDRTISPRVGDAAARRHRARHLLSGASAQRRDRRVDRRQHPRRRTAGRSW